MNEQDREAYQRYMQARDMALRKKDRENEVKRLLDAERVSMSLWNGFISQLKKGE